MKRKRRKSKLTMDFMEFSRETTRFRRGAQYLRNSRKHVRKGEAKGDERQRQKKMIMVSFMCEGTDGSACIFKVSEKDRLTL